jgi:hypothetical protein
LVSSSTRARWMSSVRERCCSITASCSTSGPFRWSSFSGLADRGALRWVATAARIHVRRPLPERLNALLAAAATHGPSRFYDGRVGSYLGGLLPICCPMTSCAWPRSDAGGAGARTQPTWVPSRYRAGRPIP